MSQDPEADRQIHAETERTQVVRYGRAGKWYIEKTDGLRQSVNLDEAINVAVGISRVGGQVHLHRPGGQTFDRRVRKALETIAERAL